VENLQPALKMEPLDSQIGRIYIDWDIHYKCNYRCNYCFQDRNKVLNINGIGEYNNKNIKYFLNLLKIKARTTSFTLGLLGGEPTLYDYFTTLEKLNNIIIDNKSQPGSEVYVSTNFSQPDEFYLNHPYYEKIYQWLSLHPDYFLKYSQRALLKRIEAFSKKTSRLIISPMLDFKNPDLTPDVLEPYLKLSKDNENIFYSPQFIFQNNMIDLELPSDFKLRDIWNQDHKEFKKDSEFLTLNEYLLGDTSQKSFLGNSCYFNYLSISPDLKMNTYCAQLARASSTTSNISLLNNCMPFLKYEGKWITCPNKVCTDYPLLLTPKKES